MYGGPLNPTTGQMGASNVPGAGMTVSITGGGSPTVTATTGADGRFSVTLKPGQYAVAPSCGTAQSVDVTAGQVTTLAIRCDVP